MSWCFAEIVDEFWESLLCRSISPANMMAFLLISIWFLSLILSLELWLQGMYLRVNTHFISSGNPLYLGWLGWAVSLMSSRLTEKTSLWACLCESWGVQMRVIKVGRPPLNVGSTTPSAGAWDTIEGRKRSKPSIHLFLFPDCVYNVTSYLMIL